MINVSTNKLIALDDGHGMGTAGKRTPYIAQLGRQIRENEFNREVVALLDSKLKLKGFKTLLLAPTDDDTPLSTRIRNANAAKADLLISIHFNAMDGVFHGDSKDPDGFSAHVHSGSGKSAEFGRIALKHLAGGTRQKNRGLVVQNLAMTRDSWMPAVLFELGFMDNLREAMLMLDKAFQEECAEEIFAAICEFYGESYQRETKPVPVSSTIKYRVRKTWADEASQVGAFHDLELAKAMADREKYFRVFDEKGVIVYQPEYFTSKPATKPAPTPAPKPEPVKAKYTVPSITLAYGSKGVQVKHLQNCLNAAGFKLRGSVDGVFGPDTLQALKRFQSVHANPADGVAGPKTRAALHKVLNG